MAWSENRIFALALPIGRAVLARDVGGDRDKALDGLRFFAFGLVFVSHFPNVWDHPWLLVLKDKGWMGVDLFFALSAFLFINIFRTEYAKNGRVNILGYFVKRFARIYPLMIAFVLYMMWWKGTGASSEWLRVLGLIMSMDNVFHALHIAGNGIQLTEHLWSLSYEFQTYLLMPAIFLISTRVKLKNTFFLLLAAAVYCSVARILVSELGATHPTVYALPFFRPESVLAGLGLAFLRPQWRWEWSAIAAATSLTAFFILPNPWVDRTGWIWSYPVLERWPGKSGQRDKWILCLTAASMAANRSEHDETTPPQPHACVQGESSAGRHQG